MKTRASRCKQDLASVEWCDFYGCSVCVDIRKKFAKQPYFVPTWICSRMYSYLLIAASIVVPASKSLHEESVLLAAGCTSA